MDSRKTAPFELGEGRDAFLLLHGFTGSPWDMLPLGEALATRGYRALGIRLPGHGSNPEAMERVTYLDWEAAAEKGLAALESHRRVFVAGLSMGALLAIGLAARHQKRIEGLLLMAPAVRFRSRQLAAIRRLRGLSVLSLLPRFIKKNGTDIQNPEALAAAPVLAAFPSARLRDLWILQDRARSAVPEVRSPALIAMAKQDHVVSLQGGQALARALKNSTRVELLELREGFHIVPRDLGFPQLLEALGSFLDRISRPAPGATHARPN
jgi:carboxylesterase